MGLIPVANDQIATVVTSLEMRARPRPRPLPDSPLRLVRWKAPALDKYRALFRRVGEPGAPPATGWPIAIAPIGV